MQGGSARTEQKWETGVKNMFQTAPELNAMCLQEAGSPPDAAKPLFDVQIARPGGGYEIVNVFAWGGSASRPFGFILFHNWDTEGHRVNTAIVLKSTTPPAEADVRLCWPAAGATHRPALGVVLGSNYLFSFHAISPKGPDGAAILTAVAATARRNPWYIGADWNRTPDKLVVPPSSVRCLANGPTHPSTKPTEMYDYFVRSGDEATEGNVVDSLVLSDHLPVAYRF